MLVKINKSNIEKIEIMTFKKGENADNIIKQYSPDYLINLGLYDMSSKSPLTLVKDETIKSGYMFSEFGFGIGDNTVVWSSVTTQDKDFIGGSPTLLMNGKKYIDWGNKYSKYIDGVHNRSVLGMDDNYLYLLSTTNKCSISNLASRCLSLGMKFAINLDGGGSSCLYADGEYIQKSSRANTSWLLVWKKRGFDNMEIKQMLITNSKKRPKIKITPKTLTIHSTANLKSTAKNERDWLMNPENTNSTGWHVCVDETQAVQAIPFNEIAYHCGNSTGNKTSISMEICESGNREKTLQNAIELTAQILKQYGWTTKNLRQHYDWNKKNCPRILRDTNRWDWFVSEVDKKLNENKNTTNVVKNKIEFKGKQIDGIIIDGTTYAPIRKVGEMLGLKVGYNSKTKNVTLS